MGVDDTLDLLLENPKSFCRYGDGEFLLIQERQAVFQEYDENLARRLKEILQSSSDKCYVGLPTNFLQSSDHVWILFNRKNIHKIIMALCNKRKLYISAAFSLSYSENKMNNFEYQKIKTRMDKCKELFRDRNLVIFSGKTVFDKLNYNVFECAKSRRHIFTESRNAWRQYKEIMEAARKFPKDEVTLCFILGPTATVAAWDLAQEGYMAWDIGHIAKDYDAFVKKLDYDSDYMKKFADPD